MTNHRLVTLLVGFVLLLSAQSTRASGSSEEDDSTPASGTFTDQWAVHITGGEQVANAIAARHGFTNLGKVRPSAPFNAQTFDGVNLLASSSITLAYPSSHAPTV